MIDFSDSKKSFTKDVRDVFEKTESLDEFCIKYHQYIGEKIIVYSKNYKEENGIIYLPIYMVMCL